MISTLMWFFIGIIVYTYAGYPAILALAAHLIPKKNRGNFNGSDSLPSITLLITAYNEEEFIADKLKNSLELDYPDDCLQILVAADGSTDKTVEIVKSFSDRGVEISFSPPRRGKTSAINNALPLARGEILVFSDANNFYQPDTLRELVAGFNDPAVGAVSGAKTIASGDGQLGEAEGLYWKYEAAIKKNESSLGTCTGVAGEVMAVRRELIESIPVDIINDDFYIAMRLVKQGYRVAYAPRARSIERVSASAQDEVTRRTRIIAGRYQAIARAPEILPWQNPLVVWQVISHKFLRPLVPLAMIGALLTNLLVIRTPTSQKRASIWKLTFPWNWIFLGLQFGFYTLAWIGGKVEKEGAVGKATYIPAFLVNSNWAALRGLFAYLNKKVSINWQRVERRKAGI